MRIQVWELGETMKLNPWRITLILISTILLTGLSASTLPAADPGDPPGRVARLSLIQGKVSFQPSGETDWSEATVNRPVSTGDRLFTDQGARAELEVGPFAVRLAPSTDVTLANLSDQLMQLGVGQGTLRVTLYELPEGNSVEIDTPNGALLLQAPGSYRVDTAPDGNSTRVMVTAGSLQVSAGDLSKTVQGGQTVQLTGTGPVMAAEIQAPPQDDFDHWCAGRDRRVQDSASARQVGPAVPGAPDLDANGRWATDPNYGPVWYPAAVPPDWVPYRYGHWVFIEPWGWTWVEAEPWGYAPFHYGRWVRIGPGWAWVPGPVVVRPVYAPALVAFVGGPGFGIGIGVQAWFPLGPREPFVPWYHYSPAYIRQVNVVNVTNITNVTNVHYVNRQAGFTAVSGEAFRGGGRVDRGIVHVTPTQISHAEVMPHPDVTPTSHAVFGSRAVDPPPVRHSAYEYPGRAAVLTQPAPHPPVATPSGPGPRPPAYTPTTNSPPHAGGPPPTPFPHVYTRNAPPPTNPSFKTREGAYTSDPGRPLEPQQMNNVRAGRPAGPTQDKEAIPHPQKQEKAAKPPAPSHEDHGDHSHH